MPLKLEEKASKEWMKNAPEDNLAVSFLSIRPIDEQ